MIANLVTKDFILKFLIVLVLLITMLHPNSGATQVLPSEPDPVDQIVNWFQTSSSIRCALNNFETYAQALEQIYGERELLIADTVTRVFDYSTRSYENLSGIFVLFTNQDSGTFTLVVVYPNGSFCEIMPGYNFTPFVR